MVGRQLSDLQEQNDKACYGFPIRCPISLATPCLHTKK